MPDSRLLLIAALFTSLAAGCSSAGNSGGGGGADESPTPTPEESPTPLPSTCEPTTGGPHWIEELQPLSFGITCATGGTAGAFEIDPLPPGASFDGVHFSWTPALTDASVYRFDVRVAATGETTRAVIGVADLWNHPENVPILDAAKYTEEFGLPVFFVSPSPVSDDEYAPATIVYRGHTYHAEAQKRGVTSIHYPKNSFTFRFDKEDKFDDEERGFDGVRRLAITQTFDDNSYIRNRLAFTLWNRMDPEHVQIRNFSAVVYLDGEYWGLYTVTDHIDDNLMRDNGWGEDGDLYKALTHEANWDMWYEGVHKDRLNLGFRKEDGLPEHGSSGAYTELNELVAFTGTSGDAQFFAEIDDRMVVRDYEQWWVFARFINAEDSGSKNSFHYLPAGGKWRYIPWDFNASFGQNYITLRRSAWGGTDFTHRNKIFLRLLSDHDRYAEINDLYRESLDGPWTTDELLALVDALEAEVRLSAKRDEVKWGAQYRAYPSWSSRTDFTDFDGEIDFIRTWLVERWQRESDAHP